MKYSTLSTLWACCVPKISHTPSSIVRATLILISIFSAHIMNAQAPDNDDCADAVELIIGSEDSCPDNAVDGTSIEATNDGPFALETLDSDVNGVWYYFTAPANGEVNMIVESFGVNQEAALFDACDGTNLWVDFLVGEELFTDLTPNEDYFVCIYGHPQAEGDFSICLSGTCENVLAIECPANITVACEDGFSPDVTGEATGSDVNDCGFTTMVSYEDNLVGECPTVIERTWFAFDEQGLDLYEECIQTITVVDDTAPVFEVFPEDLTLECSIASDLDELGEYVDANYFIGIDLIISDNCYPIQEDEFSVDLTTDFDQECPNIFVCTKVYTISDGCNEASQTWTITIVDTEAPIFDDYEEVVEVECLENVPGPLMLMAEDACSGVTYEAEIFESNTGDLIQSCEMVTANGPGDDWAFWLPVLFEQGLVSSPNFYFDSNDGTFEQYGDGTARLTGNLINDINSDERFVVDFWFENSADWTTWSSMGRTYKDDLGCAAADMLYEDWTYWELADGFSTLTGELDLDGALLSFSHNPASYYFGFQLGLGANNKNCDYGFSGWFNYDGFVAGEAVSGNGDINVDAECEINNELDCIHSDEFTYAYRVEDACGNSDIAIQTIIVDDQTPPTFTTFPADEDISCEEWPLDVAEVAAEDNCVGEVTILDMVEVITDGDCPNSFVAERTWRAIDVCGNFMDMTQTITVVDSEAPVMEGLPLAEIILECDEEIEMAVVTAMDNCSAEENITIDFEEELIEGDCAYNYTLIRTWIATDECDNSSQFVQTITVQDTTPPVFDAFDTVVYVECDEVDGVFLTATDNCGSATVEIIEETLNSGGCMGVLMRIYQATDDCGNSITVEQYITILDTTPPVLENVPADEEMECSSVMMNEGGFYFDGSEVTGTDNCMLDVEVVYSEEMMDDGDDCVDSYLIVRTWYAVDYCENEAMAQQTVTVVDTTNPVFVDFPLNETVECSDPIPAIVYPGAEDNCDEEVMVVLEEETMAGDCENSYTIHRVFRATDNCGNEAIGEQIITVQDTTPPSLEIGADQTVECDQPIPEASSSAMDNCDMDVLVEVLETILPGACPQNYTLTRVYTATDNCDNSTSLTQVIYVVDSTQPELEVAADITIECSDDLPLPEYTVSDNCDLDVDVVVTAVSEEGECPQEYVMTRTYTATDDCGNITMDIQVITVIDSTSPVFDDHEDEIEMPCDEIDDAITVSATDNCGIVTITSEDLVVSGACAGNIIRTYTAEDECGNTSTATQIITLIDLVAPEFDSFPADITVECSDSIPGQLDGELEISYSDNCTDVDLIFVGNNEIPGSCPDNYTIEFTWMLEDECENTSSMTWTVTVQDTTAPQLEIAGDTTIQCTDAIPAPEYDAEDNCGIVTMDISDLESGDDCLGYVTRTYIASDECGNSTTLVQVITIVDTIAPTVDPAGDMTIECDEDVPAAEYTTLDNCNSVNVSVFEEGSGNSCDSTITRYFTPIDACGNVGETMTQIIHILDTTAPVFDPYPLEIEVPCDDVDLMALTATDNCNEVTITYDDLFVSGNCADNIIRTYTATDLCGNSVDATQIIALIDTVAPVFTGFPLDLMLECSDEIPGQLQGEEAIMYTDNCNDVELIYNGMVQLPGSCPNEYTNQHTWTIMDECDNAVSMTWNIEIDDTTPPVLVIDQDYDLDCDEEVPAPSSETSDNCSVPTLLVEENEVYSCPQSYVLTRTYTSTDACGNSTTEIQVITVTDDEAPMFSNIPQGGSYSCEEGHPDEAPTALDNCGAVTLTVLDDYDYSCPQSYTLIRTWTAVDECENSDSIQVIYDVFDNTPPTFDSEAEDVIVECQEDVPAIPELTATDNCGIATVSHVEAVLEMDDCGNMFKIVTYTAMDECENSSQMTYTISVQDNTPPEFLNELSDVVLDCEDEIPAAEELFAMDNCIGPVEVSVSEELFGDLPDEDAIQDCNLEAANDACDTYEEPWALIFTDGYLESNDQYKFYEIIEGQWLAYDGGAAHITATVVNTANPDAGLYVDVWFENGMDFDAWTSQDFPTGVKSDCFDEAPSADWLFYIMQAGNATLEGWGDFDGTYLELVHAPTNNYFGYQVGVQANNQGGSYGSGGWFSYSGTFIDLSMDLEVEVEGAGDLSFKHDCCPQYYMERTYCATDCSGNEYCFTQTLSYGEFDPNPETNQGSIFAQNDKGEGADVEVNTSMVTPNPASERAFVDFTLSKGGSTTIDVFNLAGDKVATIFNQQIESDVQYRAELNAANLADGIYIYQVVSGDIILTDRIIISK